MKRMMFVVTAVAVVAVAGFAYLWFAGGSGEPTTRLTTPSLATADGDDTSTTGTGEAVATDDMTGELTFVIDPTRSQASFELDEELRGEPKHVVGTTSEVAGQVRLDPAAPADGQISEIVVNARTFQTDSAMRDRAIRGPVVLDSASDQFELITFAPSTITGLPAEGLTVGERLSFTVTGVLVIKDVSQDVTFEVEAAWTDESRLEGRAETVVDRTEFGIAIPNVASVANVSEEVLIAIDFVADAA